MTIYDLSTLHTVSDGNLLSTFDNLTSDLHDGSHLTEACFNLLTALRTTVEAELSVRGLEVSVKSNIMQEIYI